MWHIKQALPDVQARDIRTKEGWRIEIHIAPDIITIVHIRREQALGIRASSLPPLPF